MKGLLRPVFVVFPVALSLAAVMGIQPVAMAKAISVPEAITPMSNRIEPVALVEQSAAVYPITIDQWVQQAKLTASDGAFMDQFGASVSISGDTLVVGARYDNNNQGSAYVFKKPVGGWIDMTQKAKLTASDGAANDHFGYAVAISGGIVVIGARGNDGFKGAVYVYEKPVGGWTDMTETAKLIASDGAASKVLGNSVAISGDSIVVGAAGDTDNGFKSGAAYVFEKPVGGWTDMTETAKLLASDNAPYDSFGFSVAISGDTVMVGAVDDTITYDFQGSAYVFVRPIGGWTNMNQTAKLTASDGTAEDYFGASVAIGGDTVVVGAPGADKTNGTTIYDVGRAYFFEKPVGGWTDMTETGKLTASDGEANDDFGDSVSISGDTVAIGAWGNDDNIGAAYVFKKPVGGWSDMTETAKLTASDGIQYDDFGYSVAISLGTVVAGAHLDDDNGNSSGSAYIFSVPEFGDELALDFGASGLWDYDGTSWALISGSSPEDMVGWSGGLAMDFAASGLWNYDGSTWTPLSGSNIEDMTDWDNGLAADFGATGVWNHDGSSWSSITGLSPEDMAGWSGGLAMDFGASGVWSYDGTTWTLISGSSPEGMVGWSDGLAADFGASGLWSYDGSSWNFITGTNVEGLADWSNGLSIDFGASGVWNYDGSSWSFTSGSNPEGMLGWSSGLAMDFGASGVWSYDGTTWSFISGSNCEDMDDVDLF